MANTIIWMMDPYQYLMLLLYSLVIVIWAVERLRSPLHDRLWVKKEHVFVLADSDSGEEAPKAEEVVVKVSDPKDD